MPAVITVNKTSYDLRYPSLKGKMAARKADIPTLTAAEVVVPEEVADSRTPRSTPGPRANCGPSSNARA